MSQELHNEASMLGRALGRLFGLDGRPSMAGAVPRYLAGVKPGRRFIDQPLVNTSKIVFAPRFLSPTLAGFKRLPGGGYAAGSHNYALGRTLGRPGLAAARTISGAARVLPPATLAEALSNPRTAKAAGALLAPLPLLEPKPGYWLRVAASRAKLIGKGLKARLADALIAQSCIDADVKLITRDRDFRHFATHCGLKLA